MDEIKVFGSKKQLNKIKNKKNTAFACVLSTTAISEIPNLTGAGVETLTSYTPAVDVEVILKNQPLSFEEIAMTKNDEFAAPSPALITKAMIELLDIPFIPINAGAAVTPKVPFIELNGVPGKDMREGISVENPEEIFENAKDVGKAMSKIFNHIIIGESTPAGTTTAQGVLTALGYDVKDKISGSMTFNPHELKDSIIEKALEANNINPGDLKDDPMKALEVAGDPTLAAVAGLIIGSDVDLTLAGGTQMSAACALVKAIDPDFDFDRLCIATTIYVAEDDTANIVDITNQISKDINIYAADPFFEESKNQGLKNYTKGSAKEGVGAGGSIFFSYLNGITPEKLRETIEGYCDEQFKED